MEDKPFIVNMNSSFQMFTIGQQLIKLKGKSLLLKIWKNF